MAIIWILRPLSSHQWWHQCHICFSTSSLYNQTKRWTWFAFKSKPAHLFQKTVLTPEDQDSISECLYKIQAVAFCKKSPSNESSYSHQWGPNLFPKYPFYLTATLLQILQCRSISHQDPCSSSVIQLLFIIHLIIGFSMGFSSVHISTMKILKLPIDDLRAWGSFCRLFLA